VHSLDVIIFNAMQYTNTEKVALARKASLPGCSIASVACGEGLPQSTVKGFIKNIKKLEVKFLDGKQLESNPKKQLESNPQIQDSYNNENSNNLLFQLQ
jgi:hypothetical protein